MATERAYKLKFVVLILAAFLEPTLINALQCYTCSDCEHGSELKICNERPTNSGPSTEDDYDDDYADEYRRITAKRHTANETDRVEFNAAYSGHDSVVYSDRLKGDYQLLDNRAVDDVCYSALLYVNGTTITERGCSSMGRRTCQSLFSLKQMINCQICTTNGCNKVLVNQSESQASMSTGEHLRGKIWCLTFLPLVLLLQKYFL